MASLSSKYVWIFGASGFLGREVTAHFSRFFDAIPVVVAHKTLSTQWENAIVLRLDLENIQSEWLTRFPPFAILHAARIAAPNPRKRKLAGKRNQRANTRLLQMLYELGLKPHIVFASGSLVYGNQPVGKRADENAPLNPVAYAQHYHKGELPFLKEMERGEIPVSILRFPWLLGAGSWFRHFFYGPAQRLFWPLYGDGKNRMSFIHVSDAARAMLFAASQNSPKGIKNVFATAPVTQSAFAHEAAKILDVPIRSLLRDEMKRKFDVDTMEALLSDIPLASVKPDFPKNLFNHSTLPQMMSAVIGQFKNE